MQGTLFILRLIFVITTASIFYQLAIAIFNQHPFAFLNISSIIIGALISVGIIWIEIKYATKFIIGIFTGIIGLLIGFVASHLFVQALFLIPHIKIVKETIDPTRMKQIEDALKVGITFFFCYMAVAILFRTRNRFKVLIPFIELSKELEERFLILDSSVIIDGRINGIFDTNILKGTFVVPEFILKELQLLADSADKKKRMRGRRGLDILGELQKKPQIRIHFDSNLFPTQKEVDAKLLALAQKLNGILLTNDYNLKKIAELQQIEVINLNSLANALRPPVLPGDKICIQIIKPGEEAEQGIGYLADGTVVIVENGRKSMGQDIEIVVTNVLQTNMGRMVFGKFTK